MCVDHDHDHDNIQLTWPRPCKHNMDLKTSTFSNPPGHMGTIYSDKIMVGRFCTDQEKDTFCPDRNTYSHIWDTHASEPSQLPVNQPKHL